jgi:hypothetical protein
VLTNDRRDGQAPHDRQLPSSQNGAFEHPRVPLPVQPSGGCFTITTGPDANTATVTLTTGTSRRR